MKVLPQTRYGHSSVFDRERRLMYVFGGKSAGKCLNDLAIFDIETSLWNVVDFKKVGCSTIPQERYGHCCALHKNWLLICGGFDKDGQLIDGIQALNLNTCQWINIQQVDQQKQPQPFLSARSLFTMDVMERREHEIEMIIAGGLRNSSNQFENNNNTLQKIIVKDDGKSDLSMLNYSIIPISIENNQESSLWDKYGHCSVFKNQTLLLVGGRRNQDHELDCVSLEYNAEKSEFASFNYFQAPSTHCSLPFLNISQDVDLMMKTTTSNSTSSTISSGRQYPGFSFATLLYDSTLNCYVVGGSSSTQSTIIATTTTTELDENVLTFKDLYEDTLMKVATFLNHVDLKNFSLISKKFYTATSSDIIWKPMLTQYFNEKSDMGNITLKCYDYKKQFQELVQKKKNSLLYHKTNQSTTTSMKWSAKREYHDYKNNGGGIKKFTWPNITCPTKTINISIKGDGSMISNFLERLKGETLSSTTTHSSQPLLIQQDSVQFYCQGFIYHFVFHHQAVVAKDTDLLIFCIDLLKKQNLNHIRMEAEHETPRPPTVVLGLEEEKYKTLIFKKRRYGTGMDYSILPYIESGDLSSECRRIETIIAFEAISTVTGYGFYQLLEFLLQIANQKVRTPPSAITNNDHKMCNVE